MGNKPTPSQEGDEAAKLAAVAKDLAAVIASQERSEQEETSYQKTKRRILSMSPTIYRFLDKGSLMSTVRDVFLLRFPDTPVAEVDRALNLIRMRRQRELEAGVRQSAPSETPTKLALTQLAKIRAATPAPAAAARPPAASQLPPWASEADRKPGETDDDFADRMVLKGDPALRSKFIGES